MVVAQERTALANAGVIVQSLIAQNQPVTNLLESLQSAAKTLWSYKVGNLVREAVTDFKPDVIHIHNTHYELGPATFWAARGTGVPTILTVHNYRLMCSNALFMRDARPCELCIKGAHWNAVRYRCYRESQAASAVMASSLFLHQKVLRTYDRCIDRIICLTAFQRQKLIESGLRAEQLVIKDNQLPVTRDQVGSVRSEKSGIFLFVGRLAAEKGVDLLVRTWLARPHGPARLRIVGDGPEFAAIKSLINGRRDIELLGWQDQATVRTLMREVDWLVLPSQWYEGSPLVLGEAHTQGTPVIAPSHGAFNSLVKDGVNGRLYSPNSTSDFRRILDEAISLADASWERFSAGARLSALARIESTSVNALIRVYESAIASVRLRRASKGRTPGSVR